MGKKGTPSFLEATLVLMVIVLGIAIGVVGLKVSPNITILAAIGMVMLYAVIKRYPTDWLHEGIINGIKPGIIPIFIFILVGSLIAVWIQAGIIPTLMVIGFKLISVQWFVPSVFVVCAIVGSAVGSAFTVMSTIGIAFFGIGTTLGLNPALVVGAIVSGAVFGDKMSPLSESTNLAAAIVDADLFKHIKHMMWSTVPAFVVSFFLFMILGHTSKAASLSSIREVTDVLEAKLYYFNLVTDSFIFNVTVCMEKGAGNFDDFVEYRCSSRNDFYSKPTNFLNEVGWGHRIRVCFKYWKPTNRFTA